MTFEEFIEYKEMTAARETMVQDILDLLEDYGHVPDEVRDRLIKEEQPRLKHWHKLAAKSKSLEEFLEHFNKKA